MCFKYWNLVYFLTNITFIFGMYQFPSVYDSTMSVNMRIYWQTSYCDISSSVDITMVAKVYIVGGPFILQYHRTHYEVSKSYQHKRHHGTYPYPDSKVHGANMGPIWGRQDPGGPHVGPMNLAIRVSLAQCTLDSNSGISVPEDDLVLGHHQAHCWLHQWCVFSIIWLLRISVRILLTSFSMAKIARHFDW